MVFIFLTLMVLEIAAIIVINFRMKKCGKGFIYRLLSIVAFLVVFIITTRFMLFPPVEEIAAGGKYKIGSVDYWITESKADPYSNSDVLRQIQVRKWFPVESETELPVIVASHGSCGTIDNNRTLYRELASHGYTVLAVVHSGQAAEITYENGKTAGPDPKYLKQMMTLQPQKDKESTVIVFREWMMIRTDDLNAVMDDYIEKEGNTDFIVMGHSAGGSAAYAMARIRDDVVGCAALESPFMYDILGIENGEYIFTEEDYDVPLLSIYSDSGYPHLRDWDQYKNNVKFLDSDDEKYTNIYYEGTGHMGLCDLSLASPVLTVLLDGRIHETDARIQLERINSDVLIWLQQFT